MELVKILKYVEFSFDMEPSFLLLMSNGRQYISNKCVFIENTSHNRQELIRKYGCDKSLYELLNSPFLENYNCITNASNMFLGCHSLTRVNLTLPYTKSANRMFADCEELAEVNLTLLKIECAKGMFEECVNLEKANLRVFALNDASYMFAFCSKLRMINLQVPKLNIATKMFYFCECLEVVNLGCYEIKDALMMFYGCNSLHQEELDIHFLNIKQQPTRPFHRVP